MKTHIQMIVLTIPVLLLAGCSPPAATADARQMADMNTITNVIIKQPLYKKAEMGELGSHPTIPITIGTNSDQRHYLLTWNGAKWQVAPTNQ
jgi:hypothetical protein